MLWYFLHILIFCPGVWTCHCMTMENYHWSSYIGCRLSKELQTSCFCSCTTSTSDKHHNTFTLCSVYPQFWQPVADTGWGLAQRFTFCQELLLHPHNGLFSRTTWISQHQKGKTNLDLLEQETVSGCGISWAICKSAHHLSQITTQFFTGQMPFLSPNQQHWSTEGSDVLPSTRSRFGEHGFFYSATWNTLSTFTTLLTAAHSENDLRVYLPLTTVGTPGCVI